ncbi:MAG: amidohydrolase [Candidatus Aenigmarchaeota archaeon]|nr:amidohydrolase [Candidatus Aenigmarchaeota archaeon]
MLIKNLRYIVTMDSQRRVIRDGAIFIEGNRILDVGRNGGLSRKYSREEIIDGSGMVAIPGLIQAHTHSPMTLMRGYADDLPLMDWLQKKIWPLEAKLKPNDIYYGSLLANLEMISFGVTTFSDMYPHPEEILKAVRKSGLRAVISPAIFEEVDKNSNVKNAKKFLRNESDKIKIALGPHSPYACTKEELLEVRDISEETGAIVHIHASETQEEVRQIKEKYGMRPIEFLDSIGLLTERTLLAHSVWVSDKEINLIHKRGAKVAHCPISNTKLASGIAPIEKLKGVVSLGSDGPSSNNNLDIFEEIKAVALLHKVHNLNPTLISAQQALEMATINGARALGLEEEIGSIETGKRADVVLVDFRKPHLTPLYNPVSHLVYACNGEDVDTVVVDGKILMRHRKFSLDSKGIMKKVERIKEDLLRRVN